jgi:hypothetical protein
MDPAKLIGELVRIVCRNLGNILRTAEMVYPDSSTSDSPEDGPPRSALGIPTVLDVSPVSMCSALSVQRINATRRLLSRLELIVRVQPAA